MVHGFKKYFLGIICISEIEKNFNAQYSCCRCCSVIILLLLLYDLWINSFTELMIFLKPIYLNQKSNWLKYLVFCSYSCFKVWKYLLVVTVQLFSGAFTSKSADRKWLLLLWTWHHEAVGQDFRFHFLVRNWIDVSQLLDLRNMAGLEVLYTSVAGSISCPQDAIVCFVHWDMIKSGYRCIGSGDEVRYVRQCDV